MARYLVNRSSGGTTAEGFYKFLGHLFRYGVATGWVASQRSSGANMSVDVSVGGGDFLTAAAETLYGWNDAVENVAVSTANASNPRRDILVAYADLSVVNPTNNVGALKFLCVAGTPGASPSDPSDPTIQAAVGSGNSWQKLARVAVGANATSITGANITSLVTPMAVGMPYLWGGSSNTNGHLVPNAADDTVALLAAVQNMSNKTLAAPALTGSWKGLIRNRQGGTTADASWNTAGTSNTDTSSKAAFIQTGIVTSSGSAATAVTFPTAFNQPPLVFLTPYRGGAPAMAVMDSAPSTTGFNLAVWAPSGGSTVLVAVPVAWVAIGQ